MDEKEILLKEEGGEHRMRCLTVKNVRLRNWVPKKEIVNLTNQVEEIQNKDKIFEL